MEYANNEKYDGKWKEGKKDGEGFLFLLKQ